MHNPLNHLLHILHNLLSFFLSLFPSQPFHFLGPGHTVVLHSAVLTPVLDPDRDPGQDPGLTLTPPVDPAPVHAPMAGLIPAPLIPDATDAAMDVHGQGPALVRGLMGIGALAHHGLLSPTGEGVGKVQKQQDLTGQDHGLGPLVDTGAAALVDGNHLLGS